MRIMLKNEATYFDCTVLREKLDDEQFPVISGHITRYYVKFKQVKNIPVLLFPALKFSKIVID
jgi:cell division FtsZ-interacting protein ZapD